jgi:hypothetical protein
MLPKLLLCHYSESFGCSVNGDVIEGQIQKLYLPDDKAKHFEFILEYMFDGGVDEEAAEKATKKWKINDCMEFIKYADKYGLSTCCASVVYSAMLKYYKKHALLTSHIEIVFDIVPRDSSLRSLLAKAALSHCGSIPELSKFQRELDAVNGFATEVLHVIQDLSRTSGWNWVDPLQEISSSVDK